MKRAIVLSGGGSKGAYQIGVWKALRKLNLSYDIVTGTSVGALNSVLMVQKDYLKAIWIWYNLNSKIIFKEEFNMSEKSKNEIAKKYALNIMSGGSDIASLEQTVNKFLDLKRFYNSKIDMGLVTFKLSKFEPITLTKKNIKPSLLKDYVVASASCYPAFKKKEINGEFYIDGGIYDNLPINLAIDMGATEIIAIDLKEIGIKQKVKNKDIPITYISPKNDIGSFLIFEKNASRRAMQLGYNDTLKIYKKLDGNKYTFKKGELRRNYLKYKNKLLKYIHTLFLNNDENNLDKILKVAAFNRLLSTDNDDVTNKEFNKHVEKLAMMLGIDEVPIYSCNKFNKQLIKKFNELNEDTTIDEKIEKNKLRILLNNKFMIKYLVDLINQNNEKITTLAILFPNEFLKALYIIVIMK